MATGDDGVDLALIERVDQAVPAELDDDELLAEALCDGLGDLHVVTLGIRAGDVFNGDVRVRRFAFLPVVGGVSALHADAEFVAFVRGGVLLFLLLLVLLSFLVGEAADNALLELAAAVGCGTLLWGDLMSLAQQVCERMTGWKDYLLGFLPVYSGVLTAGGEANAGAAASGLLLTGLCFLAQGTVLVVSPLLQSYLAVSMACCISTQQGLSETCRVMGALLRRGLVWAGRIFAVLLGLQRAVTVQLDRSALRLGQLLTGGVPVIGQALSDTAEVFLAGMQLLKSSLGFAALAVIGAEFLPLYLQLLLHLLFLAGCRLLCGLAENRRCQALFDCMAEAVKCMAAVTALFFELLTVGVGLLMMTGGG